MTERHQCVKFRRSLKSGLNLLVLHLSLSGRGKISARTVFNARIVQTGLVKKDPHALGIRQDVVGDRRVPAVLPGELLAAKEMGDHQPCARRGDARHFEQGQGRIVKMRKRGETDDVRAPLYTIALYRSISFSGRRSGLLDLPRLAGLLRLAGRFNALDAHRTFAGMLWVGFAETDK